jgi:prepilin-type processing-associated H-X9-DG protein
LYEDGRAAVPEVMPWPGARVWVRLRYTPETARDGGLTEDLANIDGEAYFTVRLTDDELEQLEAGQYHLEIMHPSYEEENFSYPIGTFPYEMLATEANQPKGHRLPFDKMSPEFRNLKQQLESVDKLKELNLALSAYCADHADTLPIMLEELSPYDVNNLLTWAKGNVQYLGAGQVRTAQEGQEIAVAYDKALPDKTKRRGTNVLFIDSHVEFCRTKRLQRLGIDVIAK